MTSDFAGKIMRAAALPDEYFAGMLLRRDTAAARLDDRQRREAVAGALACGAATARALHTPDKGRPDKGTGTCLARTDQTSPCPLVWSIARTPRQLASALGIAVTEAELPGVALVLARCRPDGREIVLNRPVIDRVQQAIEELALGGLFRCPAGEIAIAHELFHCAEAGDARLFTRQYRITRWRLGPLAYRTTLPALSEIAAMACARALCRLDCSPLLLEAVLLRTYDAARADAWLAELPGNEAPLP